MSIRKIEIERLSVTSSKLFDAVVSPPKSAIVDFPPSLKGLYSDSGESISKGEISTVVVAARACGNVKNLSLLTG
jgi:hypothetical protein